MKYSEIDVNSFHRQDFYLAQIAAEVRRTIAKEPGSIHTKDFLMTFEVAPKEKPPLTEAQKALKLSNSKAYWLSLARKKAKTPPKKKG